VRRRLRLVFVAALRRLSALALIRLVALWLVLVTAFGRLAALTAAAVVRLVTLWLVLMAALGRLPALAAATTAATVTAATVTSTITAILPSHRYRRRGSVLRERRAGSGECCDYGKNEYARKSHHETATSSWPHSSRLLARV